MLYMHIAYMIHRSVSGTITKGLQVCFEHYIYTACILINSNWVKTPHTYTCLRTKYAVYGVHMLHKFLFTRHSLRYVL